MMDDIRANLKEAVARGRDPYLSAEQCVALVQLIDQTPNRWWLWKNFVDGRPEYWAFDNPYPCVSVGGDPLTLGQPCGWAVLKPSVNGRPNLPEQEVIDAAIRRARAALAPPHPAQAGGTGQDEKAVPAAVDTRRVEGSKP